MIGHRLQEFRKYLKLSQDELSAQLGVTPRAYASYERGDRRPSLSMLSTLCFEYNVNLNWLIAGVGEMFNNTNSKSITTTVEEILKKHNLI